MLCRVCCLCPWHGTVLFLLCFDFGTACRQGGDRGGGGLTWLDVLMLNCEIYETLRGCSSAGVLMDAMFARLCDMHAPQGYRFLRTVIHELHLELCTIYFDIVRTAAQISVVGMWRPGLIKKN